MGLLELTCIRSFGVFLFFFISFWDELIFSVCLYFSFSSFLHKSIISYPTQCLVKSNPTHCTPTTTCLEYLLKLIALKAGETFKDFRHAEGAVSIPCCTQPEAACFYGFFPFPFHHATAQPSIAAYEAVASGMCCTNLFIRDCRTLL